MNIEFEKLEIQNFKSIGEKVEIDYKNLTGLNFVYGNNLDIPNAKNGSGKSNLAVDALVYAIYGRTLKNTNNKYIPNRSIKNTLKSYVKLWLRSNGQLYSIETYGKFSGKDANASMGSVAMTLLKLNNDYTINEDLTQSTILKTRKYIETNIIGCSFGIFKSSVVISAADYTNFYEGLGKDQKRTYIENIFNLDTFGQMFKLIKNDFNEVKKEVVFLNKKILEENSEIERIKVKLNDYDLSLEENRKSLKNEIIELTTKFKKITKTLESEECDEAKFEEIRTKKQELEQNINRLEKLKIHKDTEIASLKEILSISDDLCKDCAKMIEKKYSLTEKREQLEQNSSDIVKINDGIEKFSTQLKTISENYNELKQHHDKCVELNVHKQHTMNEIKRLKKDYENLNSANPYENILNELVEKHKQQETLLKNFSTKQIELEVLKDICSENGIKKVLLTDIVKLLNSLIQNYLNEIGCAFMVYFDETFEMTFITATGECEYSSFSSGEKQRIQLATLFAFRDLILNSKIICNIMVIDELLDANVDSVCINNVMNILKKKSIEDKQNIFVISHRSEIAGDMTLWNNILKVTKKNNQTTYEIV